MSDPSFLFTCCQPGAEGVLKRELAREYPQWRFAFSRRGFLTFKWTADEPPSPSWQLRSVFARTSGWSLGSAAGTDDAARIAAACSLASGRIYNHLHVWQREPRDVRETLPDYVTDRATQVAAALHGPLVRIGGFEPSIPINQPAVRGELVLDCVLLEPDQWWIGWHRVRDFGQRWVAGVPRIEVPEQVVSRAYVKLREALLWSRLPLRSGDACVEIGSAPGGACQALLDLGLRVTGVDPSLMDSRVIAHPAFTHWRKRGADVPRREYARFRWLFADSNVAPKHTLDTVESIVTHSSNQIRGILLTLKLMDWKLADAIGEYARRVRSWGFDRVHCRQLACHHQEVCLAALRPAQRRT
jgi:23S rRNA (cytidine2498-2'-O)-methyltransferase